MQIVSVKFNLSYFFDFNFETGNCGTYSWTTARENIAEYKLRHNNPVGDVPRGMPK